MRPGRLVFEHSPSQSLPATADLQTNGSKRGETNGNERSHCVTYSGPFPTTTPSLLSCHPLHPTARWKLQRQPAGKAKNGSHTTARNLFLKRNYPLNDGLINHTTQLDFMQEFNSCQWIIRLREHRNTHPITPVGSSMLFQQGVIVIHFEPGDVNVQRSTPRMLCEQCPSILGTSLAPLPARKAFGGCRLQNCSSVTHSSPVVFNTSVSASTVLQTLNKYDRTVMSGRRSHQGN
jgi:hypothetical protein